MSLSVETVREVLRTVVDPSTRQNLIDSRSVRNIRVDSGRVSLDVELGYPARSQIEPVRRMVREAVQSLPGVAQVDANVFQKIVAHAVQRGARPLPQVRNILAVASGKGGVGKSTTAANLALALAAEGARVGMLDADIYGPSQPTMLGIKGKPQTQDGKFMLPMMGHGIQTASIGFLIEPDTPMVWRGPMVTQALDQLLNQTLWDDLDYLVVDMPPGTGDIHLSLAQRIPVTGAVIVTTPQDIALLDARKGLRMFEKVGVPILGVVENMSMHTCSRCGHMEAVFGSGGAERICSEYGVEYLGGLPLDMAIREAADRGAPTVAVDPEGALGSTYRGMARRIAVKVAESARDLSARIPGIVVQRS